MCTCVCPFQEQRKNKGEVMARLAYECNSDLRSNNFTNQSEILKPFACTTDKYCLYCCCNSQCCLLIHRRPPKHFSETWYFWFGMALLVLFIISSISSYIVSNCRHNFQIMTISDRRSTRPFSNNERVDEMLNSNHNEISIHVIPTTGMMLPTNDNKMFLCPPQPSASYMTPIVA